MTYSANERLFTNRYNGLSSQSAEIQTLSLFTNMSLNLTLRSVFGIDEIVYCYYEMRDTKRK